MRRFAIIAVIAYVGLALLSGDPAVFVTKNIVGLLLVIGFVLAAANERQEKELKGRKRKPSSPEPNDYQEDYDYYHMMDLLEEEEREERYVEEADEEIRRRQ